MKKILIAILAITMLGCQDKVDTKAEGEKVMQTSREWSQAASTKDLEKTLSYWSDDAVVISAGDGSIRGKADIRKMVESGFNTPGFKISWEPKSAEVSQSGDMAYLIEEAEISFPDSTGNTMTIKNNVVTIWRKQADGTWKDVVDISTPVAGSGH